MSVAESSCTAACPERRKRFRSAQRGSPRSATEHGKAAFGRHQKATARFNNVLLPRHWTDQRNHMTAGS